MQAPAGNSNRRDVVAVKELEVGFLPWTVSPPLRLRHLDSPGTFSRRLYLHFIVWSGTQNLDVEETTVFHSCACDEYISMGC